MAQLPNSGLETHPGGAGNANALINADWVTIDGWLNPALGLTASQSGTTVTASAAVFTALDDDSGGAVIRYTSGAALGTEVTITSFTNSTTVTVTPSVTVAAGTSFIIYRAGLSGTTALIRGLLKETLLSLATDDYFRWDGTKLVRVAKATGWGAPTGTPTRTTFDTATVTLPQLAERVKALIDDLTTRKEIGA